MLGSFKAWYNQPYKDGMNVPKWFLFAGLLMICGIIWTVIIKHLTD